MKFVLINGEKPDNKYFSSLFITFHVIFFFAHEELRGGGGWVEVRKENSSWLISVILSSNSSGWYSEVLFDLF